MRLRISALDLSPIPSGSTAGDALRSTVSLAQHCESLGLTRYWLAEHHNAGALACSTPEIMIALVAAATRTIRVGSGGVMLPNHSPLKVAEAFRVLGALYPGRIDLGLGRAAGTDPRTARALRRGLPATADDFPEQVEELLEFLTPDDSPRPPFTPSIVAVPTGPGVVPPEPWILGSSDLGAVLAAKLGLGFAFAHHLNPTDAVATLRKYRADFRPSEFRPTPESILALSVVCAASDEAAERLAASADLSMVRFAQGMRDLPLPGAEEALRYRYDEEEESLRRLHRARLIVGGPERARAAIEELASAAEVDEVMITTSVHDPAARRDSYSLLARALAPSPLRA